MADALCGPSNPLQTFQKQTSVDGSLQQDRLAARQAQAESFRSAPGLNAGVLDAEFEAFQAGHTLEAGFPEPQFFSSGPSPEAFGQPFGQSQAPKWAADFQNLHLNEARASPIPQSQFHQHAPMQCSTPGDWHQDFLRQQGQSPAYQPQQQQRPGSGRAYGYTGGLLQQNNSILSPIAQQKQPESQVVDNFDEAAFEQAFEAAKSDIQFEHQVLEPDLVDQMRQIAHEKGHDDGNVMQQQQAWLDHNRIGSDRILDEAEGMNEEQNVRDDADELARTAGQLLENVSGDQSKKFQDSNFLSLMRQLRDKEVRVEGDKLVDVSMLSSTA